MEASEEGSSFWLVTLLGTTLLYGLYSLFLKPRTAVAYTNIYSQPGWKFYLKQLWIWAVILKYRLKYRKSKIEKNKCDIIPTEQEVTLEKPTTIHNVQESDAYKIIAVDQGGNSFVLRICKYFQYTEMWMQIRLQDGSLLELGDDKQKIETNDESESWECGGLKITTQHPMKRLRILFNGLLVKTTSEGHKSLHHVRLNCIWSATRPWVNVIDNWSPQMLSEALAREPWKRHEWFHWVKDQGDGYEQWGAIVGEMTVDDVREELNMASLRQRRWGLVMTRTIHRRVTLTGFTYDGALFTIRATCSPLGLTHAKFGHIQLPNTLLYQIDQCDVSLPHMSEHATSPLPETVLVTFTANRKTYNACIKLNQHLPMSTVHGPRYLLKPCPTTLSVNGDNGFGFAEFWYRTNEDVELLKTLKLTASGKEKHEECGNVCSLSNRMSASTCVSGGKGSSLAKLARAAGKDFKVAPGFCITVHGLQTHLKANQDIVEGIAKLQTLRGSQLQTCSIELVKLIEESQIPPTLVVDILSEWNKLGNVTVAVRSSAIGEDSQDLSAAGQNETYLGVLGEHDLLSAVKKCWASLYAYRSVEYRRQHGQPISSGMAVVVQVMVVAETAGVIFSRNPITGDPRKLELSANYGLGESVVSAEVDPDRVVLEKQSDGSLRIVTKQCGLKQHKIVLTDEGTKKEQLTEDKKLCLSDEDILKLGNIAANIEHEFGNKALDIEWAISNGEIYLLQARPITTLEQWTDTELLRELDTPVVSMIETITFANTGEVLPGAGSALSQSVFQEVMNKGLPIKYGPSLVATHHRWALNIFNTWLSEAGSEVTLSSKVSDLTVFGHVATTPHLLHLAHRRNGCVASTLDTTLVLMGFIPVMFKTGSATKAAHYLAKSFRFDLDRYKRSEQLYQEITNQFPVLIKVAAYHTYSSQTSVLFQIIAMSVLVEGSTEFENEHFTDISLLFSVCSDVLSADIPASLQKLSVIIANCENAEEFVKIEPKDGYAWIEKNHKGALEEYHKFLKKHGHRGISEFDVMAEVYETNQEYVIQTLQNLVKPLLKQDRSTLCYEQKPALTPQEVADRLKSPKKPMTRKILKYLVYKCRKAVFNREETKGCFIFLVHQFRLAYRRLAQLMVDEGYLPSGDLLFHLTHFEIGELIRTRNPSLIMKAHRRKKLWPKWNKLNFDEIITGIPRPLPEKSSVVVGNGSVTQVSGTPVYPGEVQGRACVIADISEIDQLQEGDILITHSTDVGWSPYFPLINGIVTELGGLISHGAVVAREYGLPCIIGAQHALDHFKTGDTVLLSGSTGTIYRIDDSTKD